MRKLSTWALLLALILVFWNLGGHDLWAPDEPYFGEGAREMVVDGKWWVPHVNGVITTDKPPLFFWAIAVLSLPFERVTLWTARLPSALAALGTLLLVMRLARRRFGGERVAALAGVILVTTLMFWEKARWTQIDSLLCCLIWCSLSLFEAFRAGELGGRRAGLLFWLAAALAVLAKGPVGLLLPLGIALLILGTDRRLGRWREFAPLSGPLLFALVMATWMAAATWGSGGEYSVWGAFQEHFVERGMHGMHHKQPFWYFLEVLPVQLLPWSGLVPGALLLAWRRRTDEDRFLLSVVCFVLVFFSVSTEKRELYALPAVPAFALLTARFVESLVFAWREGTAQAVSRRWLWAGQGVIGAVFVLAGIGLPVAARGREEVAYWMAVSLAVVCLAGGLITLHACWRSLGARAALAPAAALGLAYLFAATFVYPAFEPRKSAREFSLQLATATEGSRAAGHRVLAFDLGNLPEAFSFYSDGVYTIETADPAELIEHLSQESAVWAVVHEPGLDALPSSLRRRVEVVETTRLSRRDIALVTNTGP